MDHTIFWERQSGDLCRLHAINAYFGFKKLDETEFMKLCEEYDEIIKGLKTSGMDGFSEGRCIISYILNNLDSKYVFLIPINSYNGVRNSIDIDRYAKLIKLVDGFFEFNTGHVWFNKKIKGKWYKIDSISGVNMINEPGIRNNGILLIIDDKHLYNEIDYYFKLLNLEETIDCEVILINLYYAFKHIVLTKTMNENYNSSIELFINIKELLSDYLENNRINKNTDNIVKHIKRLVKSFMSK